MGDKSPKNKAKKNTQKAATAAQAKNNAQKRQNDFDRTPKKDKS